MAADELAIVVPAWKSTFLEAALVSIAAQTDTRFRCYIFDDAGDAQIAAVCAKFPEFIYKRFADNVGGRSLVKQWNRCLAEIEQPWVWLFSDDDVMSADCVAQFHQARESYPGCRVFQFEVDMVSSDLRQTLWHSTPPAWESASAFLSARFQQKRLSCLPDHIFCWQALRAINPVSPGFVDLPLAWNADDATWLLLAQQGGIGGISNAKILWRQSEENISNSKYGNWEKFGADLAYLMWLKAHGCLSSSTIQNDSNRWLGSRLIRLYDFSVADVFRLWPLLPIERRSCLLHAVVEAMRRWRGQLRRAMGLHQRIKARQ